MSLEKQDERVETGIKGLRLLENWLLCLCQETQAVGESVSWKKASFSFFENFLKKEKEEQLRYRALEILTHLGIEETIPLFRDALSDSSKNIQKLATRFLEQQNILLPQSMETLQLALADKDWNVRVEALWSVRKHTYFNEEMYLILFHFLKTDENEFVRATAAKILGEIPVHPSTFVPLQQAFFKETVRVRVWALYALGKQYWETELVQKLLEKASIDEEEQVREMAIKIIRKYGKAGESACFLLGLCARYPQETSLKVRILLLQTLVFFGKASEEILHFCLSCALDKNSEIRATLANALGEFSVGEDVRTKTLLDLSEDPNENVRASAIWAMGNFAPNLFFVEKVSQKITQDSSWNVRLAAIETFKKIGKGLPNFMEQLSMGLEDKEPFVQMISAQCLIECGEQVEAPKKLRAYLTHPEESFRKIALALFASPRMQNLLQEKTYDLL